MARGKKHTAEQIVNLPRPVEVGVADERRCNFRVRIPRFRACDAAPSLFSRTLICNVFNHRYGDFLLGPEGIRGKLRLASCGLTAWQ